MMMAPAGASSAQVKTTTGAVRGATSADGKVRVFKGIPYAAPPVGDLRWKAPQPARALGRACATPPRSAAQCMQGPIFGDITFPQPPSEDCLNLNVWTPAAPARAAAGDGLDPRRRLPGRRRHRSRATTAKRSPARASCW